MLQVIDYHKTYRDTLAVDGLSFSVPPGAVLGLVGPNGAGKTTTMRAIAGIIAPTRGTLLVDGCNVVSEPKEAKRAVAYIPDEPRLFEPLTVWEHLQFTAAAYQVKDFEPLANQLLDQFELSEKRKALAEELSRGMRQKVAICCAYLTSPKAILFDEPHTGLDPHGIRTMKSTVIQRAEQGAAVIVSSHLLSLIEDLCTHLLILSKGRSLFFGTMESAKQQYPDLGEGTTLEEVFFRATKGELAADALATNAQAVEQANINEGDNLLETDVDLANPAPETRD